MDKSRLDKFFLGEMLKEECKELATGCGRLVAFDSVIPGETAEFVDAVGVDVDPRVFADRVLHRDAAPWPGEVQVVPCKGACRSAMQLLNEAGDDLLCEVHHIVVITVSLVDLHHRELRVVVGVDILVPEVLGDLKNLIKPADDQALEVEFRCDTEVELLLEVVVVGGERSGVGAAVDRLEGGGLKLQVIALEEVLAQE